MRLTGLGQAGPRLDGDLRRTEVHAVDARGDRLASGVVELKVKTAVPSAPVTARPGDGVGAARAWRGHRPPSEQLPLASRTVTVIVTGASSQDVDGEATMLDCAALGGAATTVIDDRCHAT